MRIRDAYQPGRLGLSIEVFPPKSEQGDAALYEALGRLQRFQPAFVSCTYGAGGSTQHRTVEICQTIQSRFGLPATAHFTCVGSTRQQLIDWLEYATQAGVNNIMALRGDPPRGSTEFCAVAGGLTYANELVSLIREAHPEVGIGVAGYPEKHPEAASLASDLDNLKRKVDAGADAVFTQVFFDNHHFLNFVERCRQAGIRVPIVPGIMPVTEYARIQRITSLCGTAIPETLGRRLEAVQDDPAAQFAVGVEFAIQQCSELATEGVPGIHFYVLNRSEATEQILETLEIGACAA